MQQRGIEIVHVGGLFDDVVAEVVGLAEFDSSLDPPARRPHAEIPRVVVAAVGFLGQLSLRIDRPPELAPPDHQCRIEQAALFQVVQQGGTGLVDIPALQRQVGGEIPVLVPAPVQNLHRPHAPLHQPAGQQGTRRKTSGGLHIRPIRVERGRRFAPQVDQLGNAGLHAKRHLVLGNAGLNLGIVQLGELPLVERLQGVQHRPSIGDGDPGRVLQVQHRVPDTSQRHAAVAGGQKPAGPHPREQRLGGGPRTPGGCEDHKRWQVVCLGPQPVRNPRPQAGLSRDLAPRHHVRARRVVIDGVGVHRLHHREVVDQLRGVRQQFTHPPSALAMLGELELRRCDRQPLLPTGHRRDPLTLADAVGEVLVEMLLQPGLVIPQVELRGTAIHMQVNDRLRLGREMGKPGKWWVNPRSGIDGIRRGLGQRPPHVGPDARSGQQAQGRPTQPDSRRSKKLPTVHPPRPVPQRVMQPVAHLCGLPRKTFQKKGSFYFLQKVE